MLFDVFQILQCFSGCYTRPEEKEWQKKEIIESHQVRKYQRSPNVRIYGGGRASGDSFEKDYAVQFPLQFARIKLERRICGLLLGRQQQFQFSSSESRGMSKGKFFHIFLKWLYIGLVLGHQICRKGREDAEERQRWHFYQCSNTRRQRSEPLAKSFDLPSWFWPKQKCRFQISINRGMYFLLSLMGN